MLLVLLIAFPRVSPAIGGWLSGLDAPSDVVGTPHGPDIDVTSGSVRTLERKPAVGLRLGVASGTFTAAANAAIMTALHTGDLAVVAVLNNLYPVSTIVLAWLVLRERLSPLQLTGVALAVVASVLLGLA